jgi:hypothetical protein
MNKIDLEFLGFKVGIYPINLFVLNNPQNPYDIEILIHIIFIKDF